MPTLNIDVNARTEKAKRDLRALDKEVLKISKSEAILEKALKKTGDIGPQAFRKIQSAAVRQAKAVNTSALQFKQLRAQMIRLGAGSSTIGRVTSEFIRFRKEMERGVVGTTRFQKAQDRLKAVLGTTKRQLVASTAAINKANVTAKKGGRSITGLGTTLENLGSTAVLVAGPLSGIGSRLIAFGAIAKRGSLLAAGFFSAIALGGVIVTKSIKAFDALNLSLAKTKAILKATGKEAQITSEFVEEVASNLARRTLANVEETRPGAAALLSFKGINVGNLERVLAASQDISSLGLTDFTNALKLLGRASEDPIANLDSLRRVGIQLTLAQKDQITALQNMGRGMEGFNIILDTVDGKVGGLGESLNIGLAGALDRLGQSWTHMMETIGKGALRDTAVQVIDSISDALGWLTGKFAELNEGIEEYRSNMKDWSKLTIMGVEVNKGSKVTIPLPPPLTVEEPPKVKSLTPSPPSGFEKALIDVNTGLKRSIIDLDSEREKLQYGFTILSPEILKLAEKFKVLPDVIRALKGNFSGLTIEGRKIIDMMFKTNEALLGVGRRREAEAVFRDTRTELEKYNSELKRLIFLYDNAFISTDTLARKHKKLREAIVGDTSTALVKYNKELRRLASFYNAGAISANDLIVKQRELRATLESTTPELNILTTASEKFGDSLADLMIKGEDFASGLKSIFKSLVDDILKQFLKLAVINPIMNAIFGGSSSRPELGSQGGGKLGLGGAGGLLGGALGGAANDNASQESLDKVAMRVEETGFDGAERYGEALGKTNAKMGAAGAKGVSGFGNVFSGIASGMASAVGGAVGSFLGNAFADLLGFQHGGSFKVGGSGGRDSQLVAFKASPRERVSVETPGQQGKRGGGNVTYIDARGVDPGQMDRLIQVVKDLDESVEVRAVGATADARDRNPSLFGRTS